MRRISVAVALASGLGALAAGSVLASGGGTSIANAPEVPLNQQIVSGTDHVDQAYVCGNGGTNAEFWRVTMKAADKLVVDYGSTNGEVVIIGMLPPSTTDYTISQTKCLTYEYTSDKSEARFIAPYSGSWILSVHGGSPLAYEMTVHVLRYTHASLNAPRVARAHAPITLRGRISGLRAGKVAIQSRSKKRWKTLTLIAVKPNGSFAYKTRVGELGTYRARVVFYGDVSHLPTSAVVSIKVV